MSYFKEFLKDKSVGAISSSSKAMGNVMYGSLNLKEAESVAEFGAGDGVFTTEIYLLFNALVDQNTLMLTALAAYFLYVINAAQFLLKLRMARLEGTRELGHA